LISYLFNVIASEEKRTYVWDRNEKKKKNAMDKKENTCYGSYNVNRNAKKRERKRERERDSYEGKTRIKGIIKKYN